MLPRRQPQPAFRNRVAVADWTNGPATNIVPLASASARSPVIAPGYGIEPWPHYFEAVCTFCWVWRAWRCIKIVWPNDNITSFPIAYKNRSRLLLILGKSRLSGSTYRPSGRGKDQRLKCGRFEWDGIYLRHYLLAEHWLSAARLSHIIPLRCSMLKRWRPWKGP